MRILVAIPHFFRPDADGKYGSARRDPRPRIAALSQGIQALHSLFNARQIAFQDQPQQGLQIQQVNQWTSCELNILLCTTGDRHLLSQLPVSRHLFQHIALDCPDRELGFYCQRVLGDRLSENYDYYCYLEDDLTIRDPLFFLKQQWFQSLLGETAILQPHRFEWSNPWLNNSLATGSWATDEIGECSDSSTSHLVSSTHPDVLGSNHPESHHSANYHANYHKVYVDPDFESKTGQNPGFAHHFTERRVLVGQFLGQPIQFQRAGNPHAGCFFLTRSQMTLWASTVDFGQPSNQFIGPLESAASLHLMRYFRVYKPALSWANFLEIEHWGQYNSQDLLNNLHLVQFQPKVVSYAANNFPNG